MDLTRTQTQSNHIMTIQEFQKELSRPRDFKIVLTCPNCAAPLLGYACTKCKTDRNLLGKFSFAGQGLVGSVLVITGFGSAALCFVIGAVLFGPKGGFWGSLIGLAIARLTIVDVRRELAAKKGLIGDDFRLASKYQDKPEAYDQAAVCYFRWLASLKEFSVPKGLVDFVRNYRNASSCNVELRESLFDALMLQACSKAPSGKSVREDKDLKQLFVLTFTGSARQEAILQAYLDWYIPKVHSIYSSAKEKAISEIRNAHAAGADIIGVDLRLPSPKAFLRRIQGGKNIASEIDPEMCALALNSSAYREQLAEGLKSLDMPEIGKIATSLPSQSVDLAHCVGEALEKNPAGNRVSLSKILILVVPAWGLLIMLGGACAFAADWPAAVAGTKIKLVGWILMILGASCPLTGFALLPAALREKRKFRQLGAQLSQI